MNCKCKSILKGIALTAALVCLITQVAIAKTYYVSPDGDDYGDGSREMPWKNLGIGDGLGGVGILEPGDTVIVKAGTYDHSFASAGTIKNCSGTAEAPITYVAQGNVILDGGASTVQAVLFTSGVDHIIFDGFEIKGAKRSMNITGTDVNPCTGIVIRNCTMHDNLGGFMIQTARIENCKIYNNVLYINDSVTGAGASRAISNGFTLFGNKIWNNTICINNIDTAIKGGVFFSNVSAVADMGNIGTDEVKNNIIWPKHGGHGIWTFSSAPVYDPPDMPAGSWYGVPLQHSHNAFMPDMLRFAWVYYHPLYPELQDCNLLDVVIRGITLEQEGYWDPLFVNPAAGDFSLQATSPVKEAGIDVGLPFNGSAPDMGALPAYAAATVGDALSKQDGTRLTVSGIVLTVEAGVFKGDVVYVEDESRASGVMVSSGEALPPYSEGTRVTVSGILSTVDGQRVILGGITPQYEDVPLKPLGTPGKSLSGEGLDNVGLLATTWGKVTFVAADSSYFCIDDGSGKTDGLGNAGVPVVVSDLTTAISSLPALNQYVSVTGLIGKKEVGDGGGIVAVISPRGSDDIR